MRLQALLVAFTRTASKHPSARIVVKRAGFPDREMSQVDAYALVRDSADWRGEGNRRRVTAVVFDPLPPPDPEWEYSAVKQGRGCIWANAAEGQRVSVIG